MKKIERPLWMVAHPRLSDPRESGGKSRTNATVERNSPVASGMPEAAANLVHRAATVGAEGE